MSRERITVFNDPGRNWQTNGETHGNTLICEFVHVSIGCFGHDLSEVSSFGFKRHDLFLFNVARREWAAHTRKNTWRHGHGAAEFRRNSDQTTKPRPRNDDATNDASTTLLSRDVDVRMRHFCASSLMIARKCSFCSPRIFVGAM